MNILEFLAKYFGCPCTINPDIQDAMFGTCHQDECCEDDFVMCWMRVLDKFGVDYFTRSQHESTDNKI